MIHQKMHRKIWRFRSAMTVSKLKPCLRRKPNTKCMLYFIPIKISADLRKASGNGAFKAEMIWVISNKLKMQEMWNTWVRIGSTVFIGLKICNWTPPPQLSPFGSWTWGYGPNFCCFWWLRSFYAKKTSSKKSYKKRSPGGWSPVWDRQNKINLIK